MCWFADCVLKLHVCVGWIIIRNFAHTIIFLHCFEKGGLFQFRKKLPMVSILNQDESIQFSSPRSHKTSFYAVPPCSLGDET